MTIAAQRVIYRFSNLVLDLGNETLRTTKGTPVALRPKSFALLRLLVENPGRLVTRSEIMEVLWPNVFVTDDSITQCVLDVRKALGGGLRQSLKTVRRRGYVFEPDVLRQEICDPPIRGHEAADFDSGISIKEKTVSRDGSYTGSREVLGPSVLLLPLKALDKSDVAARIAESFTEDILSELTGYAKTSAPAEMRIQFHDDRLRRLPALLEDRGAVYVLRGSVQSKPAMRLSLQLLEAGSGACVWANRSELSGPNGHGARLAQQVSAAVFRDVGRRVDALPIQDLTADDLLLQGQSLLLRPRSVASLRQALRRFEQAIVMDPESGGARLGIATVLVANLANGWSRSIEQDEARADALLRDVLEVSTDFGLAHGIKGSLRRIQGRLKESKVELEIATELAPEYAMAASQLGWTLAYSGQPDKALHWFERGVQVGGHHSQMPLLLSNLGTGRLLVGDPDTGIDLLLTAAAGIPEHSSPLLAMAAAFGLKSEGAAAGAALRQGVELCPALRTLSVLRSWVGRQGPEFMPVYQQTMERGLRCAGMPEE
jgi:DNA-binding winged helix-turn-helix (wHTH) protein/tetratricopeptide (TPR) repeat protein